MSKRRSTHPVIAAIKQMQAIADAVGWDFRPTTDQLRALGFDESQVTQIKFLTK